MPRVVPPCSSLSLLPSVLPAMQLRRGSFMFDPYAGTGSILVAAAVYGAKVRYAVQPALELDVFDHTTAALPCRKVLVHDVPCCRYDFCTPSRPSFIACQVMGGDIDHKVIREGKVRRSIFRGERIRLWKPPSVANGIPVQARARNLALSSIATAGAYANPCRSAARASG